MKQPDDAPEMSGRSAADQPPKAPGKKRLLTLDALDGRTKAFQHVRKGIQAIEADLGGAAHLSHAERSLIARCAVLTAMLADQEASYLTGGAIDPTSYATLTNALRRTLQAVGLQRRAKDITNLSDYLASKAEVPA